MKISAMFLVLILPGCVSLFLYLYIFKESKVFFLDMDLAMSSLCLNFNFIIDTYSSFFLFVVCFISSMVFLYGYWYFSEVDHHSSFFSVFFLFVLSMIFLITVPSYLGVILGWDGLGLSSYCLILYYRNLSSSGSAMLTALLNRVGDVVIMMSIFFLCFLGSWDVIMINSWSLGGMIVFASLTKSAQYPFSIWLPEAMAAPTPVSSLVHSSTLITAGVYLCIRFYAQIYSLPMICEYLFLISIMTLTLGSVNGIMETDLKKIIAFSTLCQVSMMFMIFSIGGMEPCFMHLCLHAMFKSSLFMCGGVIIHQSGGWQDMRMVFSWIPSSPLVSSLFIVNSWALCGLPFLSGFYSKDLIIELLWLSGMAFFPFLVFFGCMLSTSFYMGRMIYMLSGGSVVLSSRSVGGGITKPITMTSVMSVVSGGIMSWTFMQEYTNFTNFYFKILMSLMFIGMGLILSIYDPFLTSMWLVWNMMLVSSKIIAHSFNISLLDMEGGSLNWAINNTFSLVKLGSKECKIFLITFFFFFFF